MRLFPGDSSSGVLPPIPRFTARTLIHVCGLFFLSRLLVLAAAALSRMVIAQGPFTAPGRTWIERFVLWDSGWYLDIATHGYNYRPDAESSVAFYPLYPLLLRAGAALGMDLRLTGYAISHAALLGACLLLWKLAALETRSRSVADRAVLFLLFCPGAVWFGMIYTESLFLVTSLGCLLCARRGRWLAAGLCGIAAALSRTPGLLLAGFLFLEGLQQGWERRRLRLVGVSPAAGVPPDGGGEPGATDPVPPPPAAAHRGPFAWPPWWARVALGVAGPVIGHACYLAFLQIHFGDWRAQQKTAAAGWIHGDGLTLPWTALAQQWQAHERYIMAISTPLLGITVALALISLFTLRRVGYAALICALCVLYVSATPGDATTRYLATAAPVYIVLAQLADRSRLLETAALVFSVALMVILTILLVNGYRVN